MAREVEAYFAESVRASADALLATTNPTFRFDAEGSDTVVIDSAGVVGFVGAELRGMFIVGVGGQSLRAMRAELYDDWIGELANQLAGRVKNQLWRFGLTYHFTPPIMLRGDRLAVAAQEAQLCVSYSCASGQCRVWASLEVLRPVALAEPEEAEAGVAEGDLVLF